MKNILVIYLFLAIGYIAVNAADFSVLSKSGYVQKKNGSSWANVNTGDYLTKKDIVKISKRGYVGLVFNQNRKMFELNKPGTYDLSKIAKDLSKKKGSISKQLAKYFTDELTSSNDYFKSNNYKNNLESNTGAVERAVSEGNNSGAELSSMTGIKSKDSQRLSAVANSVFSAADLLSVRTPRTSYVVDENINFIWYKYKNIGNYTFVIKDRNNREMYKKNVKDTSLSVNLNDIKLAVNTNYFWHIEVQSNKSDEYEINRLNSSEIQAVNDTVSQIKDEFDDPETSLCYAALAAFYADKNIAQTAEYYYKKAFDTNPEVDDFKNIYAHYLIRIGLFSEAKSLIK